MGRSKDTTNIVTLPSGLVIHELRPGTGAPAEPGDRCSVAFKGWLKDPSQPFDGTTGDDEPLTFRLREGEIIDGWLEGVTGMCEGGIRRLVVPASMAYGPEGRDGVIPPDAELTFEIKLLQVHKRSPDTRLLIAPQARVRWQGKTIEVYVPGDPRTVECADSELLQIMHEFSEPTRVPDIAARFPHLPPEDIDTLVEELEAAHVLVPTARHAVQAAPSESPIVAATSETGIILFVLPPSLVDNGRPEVPSSFLFLGSLAAQAGFAVDLLVATDTRTEPPASWLFAGPSQQDMPPVLFLGQFIDMVLDRLARLSAQGARPVLALSCFSSALFTSSMMLGALARARFPDLPIAIGGCHPTIAPESLNAVVGSEMDVLAEETKWRPVAAELFKALDDATAFIRGRNDFVFDLVFSGRADRNFVPGIQALVRDGRKDRPQILPADPMDDGQLAAFRYHGPLLSRVAEAHLAATSGSAVGFPISFSLGCPYTCAFCINSMTHEHWQGMHVEHAIETLEQLHDVSGTRRFYLIDANFAARKSWREAFFAGLARKPWIEDIHIDTETAVLNWELEDYGVLDRLSLTLQIGVESCAPEILLRMGKCKRPAEYLESLKALVQTLAPRVDHISLMMILGYPGETRETLRQTFAFLMDECRVLSHHNVEMCPQLYLPLQGTRAFQQTKDYAERHGYRPSPADWWKHDGEDRFAGLRPSRELSVETCSGLAQVVAAYYRGVASREKASDPNAKNVCAVLTHSKLEQREFRAKLMQMIERSST